MVLTCRKTCTPWLYVCVFSRVVDIQFGLGCASSSDKGTPPGTLTSTSNRIYPNLEDISVSAAPSLSPSGSAHSLQADRSVNAAPSLSPSGSAHSLQADRSVNAAPSLSPSGSAHSLQADRSGPVIAYIHV